MEENNQPQKRMGSRKGLLWVIALVVIAIIVLWQLDVVPGRAGYQAVFLSNNQVYFGKLSRESSSYPVLRDIYYLRITTQLQPTNPNAQQQQVNLVKLGNELHGPEDEMRINRNHILFIEDLKSESQVVAAIEDFKANQQEE